MSYTLDFASLRVVPSFFLIFPNRVLTLHNRDYFRPRSAVWRSKSVNSIKHGNPSSVVQQVQITERVTLKYKPGLGSRFSNRCLFHDVLAAFVDCAAKLDGSSVESDVIEKVSLAIFFPNNSRRFGSVSAKADRRKLPAAAAVCCAAIWRALSQAKFRGDDVQSWVLTMGGDNDGGEDISNARRRVDWFEY